MRTLPRNIAVFVAAFLLGVTVLAAEPTDTQLMPSAAELVQGIIDQESKIDSVRSIHLRFEGKWTRSAEAIARTIAELKQKPHQRAPDVERDCNLWPEMTEELEFAFDSKRFRKLAHWHKFSYNLRVFDGQRAIGYMKYFSNPNESYRLETSVSRLIAEPFDDLSWLRMGYHEFWFWKESFDSVQRMQFNGLPKDYRLVEQADFRGRRCYILDNPMVHRRLYVGTDDRRLYGLIMMIAPAGADPLPAVNKAAQRTFASLADVDHWLKAQTQDEQRRFAEQFNIEMFASMRPWAEHFMDDYRELAPGFWCPTRQGYTLRNVTSKTSLIDVKRELHLIEAKVNEPLSDDLFTLKLKDGVHVFDQEHDPPLRYEQKHDRTPEEWTAIIDKAKRENDEWKKENAARDALVGKPVPELPKSSWLNSKPLDWTALKGKVVVLDFWSAGCGPCRNVMPALEAIHKKSSELGIAVISVHNSGAESGEIDKFAKEMGLSYPIVIDLPPPKEHFAGGLLSSQMNVKGIPYMFVIDPEGRVAAHGSLNEVLAKAYDLANKVKK